jgi:hypothetical protein
LGEVTEVLIDGSCAIVHATTDERGAAESSKYEQEYERFTVTQAVLYQ